MSSETQDHLFSSSLSIAPMTAYPLFGKQRQIKGICYLSFKGTETEAWLWFWKLEFSPLITHLILSPFSGAPPVSPVTPLCPPIIVFLLLIIFPYIYNYVSVSSWNKQHNLACMSILSLWATIQILFLSNILIKTYSTCNLFLLSLSLSLLFFLLELQKFYLRPGLSKYGHNWVPNDKWKRILVSLLLSISRILDPDRTFLTDAFSSHRF